MAKFSNVKPKDTVYHLLCGKGTVTTVSLGGGIVCYFRVKFDNCEEIFDVEGYLLDEKFERVEKIATLFWNEVKLPTDEEDKRPFDLVEYLRDNIEPTEFIAGAENVTFSYDYLNNSWNIGVYNFVYVETIYISKKSEEEDYLLNDILNVFAENKVTPQQLKQAYKELGWL